MCGRQFVIATERMEIKNKPVCPVCSRKMNLYMKQGNIWRFRCSGYPLCKTYKKFIMEVED